MHGLDDELLCDVFLAYKGLINRATNSPSSWGIYNSHGTGELLHESIDFTETQNLI